MGGVGIHIHSCLLVPRLERIFDWFDDLRSLGGSRFAPRPLNVAVEERLGCRCLF